MTNGSLMMIESIAECSPWSILHTFDLHLAIIGLENQFVFFLRVAVLLRFYCSSLQDAIFPPVDNLCEQFETRLGSTFFSPDVNEHYRHHRCTRDIFYYNTLPGRMGASILLISPAALATLYKYHTLV